jgi:thiol-disulfide isomerase/thioredoxin
MHIQMRTATIAVALMLAVVLSCKRAEQPAPAASTSSTQESSQPSATSSATTPPPADGKDVGATMPEYTAMGLDGSKFDLAARRDKVVLLNVWATWCGPCRFEIPELQNLHEQYGPRGFEVIGVSVDESGVDSVKQFIAEQKKMTYPIVVDAEGKIANILQTSVLPTSIVVDRNGKIVWKQVGAIEAKDEKLKKALEAAL